MELVSTEIDDENIVCKYWRSCDESLAVNKPESLRYACISQLVPTVSTSQ
jgi:hypothetical protein